MVNHVHSERKCNVQELQLSLIADNRIAIKILLQGILLISYFLISEAVLRGIIHVSDSSSPIP
jgi:hypothetical protein